ncbi:MAG: hypothetical protein HC778_00080 [Chamaesiphon sp. CSU_1_12]|nr:hypothetical protein [Chamaesiphon sp. CSU_1_12]
MTNNNNQSWYYRAQIKCFVNLGNLPPSLVPSTQDELNERIDRLNLDDSQWETENDIYLERIDPSGKIIERFNFTNKTWIST